MRNREELKQKAQHALKKAAVLGPDIDLEEYDVSDVAHEMITETALPLSEVAMRCGFADQSHLCRLHARFYDQSPTEARRVYPDT